jgi:hypothetical protein
MQVRNISREPLHWGKLQKKKDSRWLLGRKADTWSEHYFFLNQHTIRYCSNNGVEEVRVLLIPTWF